MYEEREGGGERERVNLFIYELHEMCLGGVGILWRMRGRGGEEGMISF